MRCVSYIGKKSWKICENEDIKAADFQNKCIRELLDKHADMVVMKKYTDFEKMVNDGIKGKYDFVIFASLYFCGSGYTEAKSMLFDILYQAGIHFIIADEEVDSSKMSEKEMHSYFVEKRRFIQSCRMKRWKKSQGAGYMLPGSVPYGYIWDNTAGSIVKDADVSRYVNEIFERAISGESPKMIAGFLNEIHADTPLVHKKKRHGCSTDGLNNEWNENKVRRIMRNPVYAGIVTDPDGNTSFSGLHESYTTAEEYMVLSGEKSVKRKGGSRSQTDRYDNPLSSYVYCREHNKKLICRKLKSTGEYTFCCSARCNEKDKDSACRFPYRAVYEIVTDRIEKERKLAGIICKRISAGEYTHEYNIRKTAVKNRMDKVIEQMKPGMSERVSIYKDYIGGKTDSKKYQSLLEEFNLKYSVFNDELEILFEDSKRIDILFSMENPWIKLFAPADEIPDMRNIIDRVEINTSCREEKISAEVFFKCSGWKSRLINDAEGEVEKYGKEE